MFWGDALLLTAETEGSISAGKIFEGIDEDVAEGVARKAPLLSSDHLFRERPRLKRAGGSLFHGGSGKLQRFHFGQARAIPASAADLNWLAEFALPGRHRRPPL
jgi:hypothetical protein